MTRKTRITLQVVAILLVLASVFMRIGEIKFFGIEQHYYWIAIIAFAMVLIGSRR